MPKTYRINTAPAYPGASYADNRLTVRGYVIHFGVGEIKPGEQGRKITGGDLVPGPWAFVFGLATVIDNHGGTQREIAEQRARGALVEAEIGDKLLIENRVYTIRPHRSDRHYIELELSANEHGFERGERVEHVRTGHVGHVLSDNGERVLVDFGAKANPFESVIADELRRRPRASD